MSEKVEREGRKEKRDSWEPNEGGIFLGRGEFGKRRERKKLLIRRRGRRGCYFGAPSFSSIVRNSFEKKPKTVEKKPKTVEKKKKTVENVKKIFPNVPKIVEKKPKIVEKKPKIVEKKKKTVENVKKIFPNVPKIVEKKPKTVQSEPKIFSKKDEIDDCEFYRLDENDSSILFFDPNEQVRNKKKAQEKLHLKEDNFIKVNNSSSSILLYNPEPENEDSSNSSLSEISTLSKYDFSQDTQDDSSVILLSGGQTIAQKAEKKVFVGFPSNINNIELVSNNLDQKWKTRIRNEKKIKKCASCNSDGIIECPGDCKLLFCSTRCVQKNFNNGHKNCVLSCQYFNNLYLDNDLTFSGRTILVIGTQKLYLNKKGYTIHGTAANGDCFFEAIKGSVLCEAINCRVDIVNFSNNDLRFLLAKNCQNKSIEKENTFVSMNDGCKMCKVLNVPIRVISCGFDTNLTASIENGKLKMYDDMYFIGADGKVEGMPYQEYIIQNDSIKNHLKICDFGGHFAYFGEKGKKRNKIDKIIPKNNIIPNVYKNEDDEISEKLKNLDSIDVIRWIMKTRSWKLLQIAKAKKKIEVKTNLFKCYHQVPCREIVVGSKGKGLQHTFYQFCRNKDKCGWKRNLSWKDVEIFPIYESKNPHSKNPHSNFSKIEKKIIRPKIIRPKKIRPKVRKNFFEVHSMGCYNILNSVEEKFSIRVKQNGKRMGFVLKDRNGNGNVDIIKLLLKGVPGGKISTKIPYKVEKESLFIYDLCDDKSNLLLKERLKNLNNDAMGANHGSPSIRKIELMFKISQFNKKDLKILKSQHDKVNYKIPFSIKNECITFYTRLHCCRFKCDPNIHRVRLNMGGRCVVLYYSLSQSEEGIFKDFQIQPHGNFKGADLSKVEFEGHKDVETIRKIDEKVEKGEKPHQIFKNLNSSGNIFQNTNNSNIVNNIDIIRYRKRRMVEKLKKENNVKKGKFDDDLVFLRNEEIKPLNERVVHNVKIYPDGSYSFLMFYAPLVEIGFNSLSGRSPRSVLMDVSFNLDKLKEKMKLLAVMFQNKFLQTKNSNEPGMPLFYQFGSKEDAFSLLSYFLDFSASWKAYKKKKGFKNCKYFTIDVDVTEEKVINKLSGIMDKKFQIVYGLKHVFDCFGENLFLM